MQDIQKISEEYGLEEPPAKLRHSDRLKGKLLDHFGKKIQFTKIGNKNVLHSTDLSSLTYTEATLIEHGLREDDIAKAFANLIRRKFAEKIDFEKTCRSKAPTISEFLRTLNESKPLSCLLNTILWSINPRHRKHNDGYVQVPNSVQAEKISMIAESLERLITNKFTSTSTSLRLTVD